MFLTTWLPSQATAPPELIDPEVAENYADANREYALKPGHPNYVADVCSYGRFLVRVAVAEFMNRHRPSQRVTKEQIEAVANAIYARLCAMNHDIYAQPGQFLRTAKNLLLGLITDEANFEVDADDATTIYIIS
jgi:hypothetical protein